MAKVEISKRLLLINSAGSVATRVISATVFVWLQQYLLKRISAEEYSLLPVLSSVVVFLPLLTTVFSAGLGRYVTEAYARGDERRVTQIVSTMFLFHVGTGLVILVIGSGLAWYVDSVLTIAPDRVWEARVMLGLMVFALAASVTVAPFSVGFYVRQRFVLSSLIMLAQEAFRIGLLFALLLGVSTSVVWVVVASVSASLIGLVVNQIVSRRLVPALKFRVKEIRWALAKELTSFGGWTILAQVADMIRWSSDPIILNKFSTPVGVNSFYIGAMPVGLILQASSLVQRPMMPQLTAMYATGAKERLQNAYLRGGRYALWTSLLLIVPLIVFSRELIFLYVGGQYADAATVMVLLLISFPVVHGHMMLSNITVAMARMRTWGVLTLVLQLLNLGLTLYFVGWLKMGAVGSALGTCVVMTVAWPLVAWPLGLRYAEASWGTWLRETLWPGLVPAAAGATACLGLKFLVQPATWLSLGLCAAAGALCHVGVLLRFCLKPYDKENLGKVVAPIRNALAGWCRLAN